MRVFVGFECFAIICSNSTFWFIFIGLLYFQLNQFQENQDYVKGPLSRNIIKKGKRKEAARTFHFSFLFILSLLRFGGNTVSGWRKNVTVRDFMMMKIKLRFLMLQQAARGGQCLIIISVNFLFCDHKRALLNAWWSFSIKSISIKLLIIVVLDPVGLYVANNLR